MDRQTTADRLKKHRGFLRAGAALSGAAIFLTGCHADREPIDVIKTVAPESNLSPAEINDYNGDVTREVSESLGRSLGYLPERILELGRTPDYNFFVYELGVPGIPEGVADENSNDINTLVSGDQKHVAVQQAAGSRDCESSGVFDYHIGWTINPNGSRRLAVLNLMSSIPESGPRFDHHSRTTHWLRVEARNDGGFVIDYSAPSSGRSWTGDDKFFVSQTNSPGIQTDVDPEIVKGLLEHFEDRIKNETQLQRSCDTL